MATKNKCNLCGKDRKNFDGFIWYYHTSPNTELCRSCYMKWCKTNECKLLEKKYKKAKPTTKTWDKKCKEQQKAFDKWYYANGGVDG